jgi:ADP-ribose pyrophosphatase YjhB (NUDIX family)
MADQFFPEPTVGVFIFNQTGEMLLLKSHKWPGKYVVPGGHVELGERLEEAALRDSIFIISISSTFSSLFMTLRFGKSGTLFSLITPAKRTLSKWN